MPMRFEYGPSPWELNDKDHNEDGYNSIHTGGLFPLISQSEVWNGSLSSISSLDGGCQTVQVIPPHPRALDAAACSSYAILDRSLLVARYSGKANHSFDVGTVLADGPLPKDVAVFYFEATFHTHPPGTDQPPREGDNDGDAMESSEDNEIANNNRGEGSAVQESEDRAERGEITERHSHNSIDGCIGLVGDRFPMERPPGVHIGSVGLRCIDGKVQQAPAEDATECAPPIHSGDTVGCGVIMASQKVFFTHNGNRLSQVDLKPSISLTQELYPAVAVHGPGESVTVNFGQEPLKFDLRTFEEGKMKLELTAISKIQVNDSLVEKFVADYLLRQGCEKTLASLRDANREIWSRESVTDAAAAVRIPSDDSIPMENGEQSSMSKCDEDNDGDVSMMQAEFVEEDWAAPTGLTTNAEQNVEMEESDSSLCFNDEDEEKKTEDISVKPIPVSSILLNGVSLESFEGNLQLRSVVKCHLLSGDVANAMNLLRSNFPVLEQKPHIWGALGCQEFIERIKRHEFIEAVHYARKVLAPNMLESLSSPPYVSMNTSTGSSPRGNKRPMGIPDCHKRRIGARITTTSSLFHSQKDVNHFQHRRKSLQSLSSHLQRQELQQHQTTAAEVVGLLAYKDIDSSPLLHLLSEKRRQHVAYLSNEAVVESTSPCSPMGEWYTLGGLELLAAHYVVTQELLYEEAGGRGRPFVLEDCMNMNSLPS